MRTTGILICIVAYGKFTPLIGPSFRLLLTNLFCAITDFLPLDNLEQHTFKPQTRVCVVVLSVHLSLPHLLFAVPQSTLVFELAA